MLWTISRKVHFFLKPVNCSKNSALLAIFLHSKSQPHIPFSTWNISWYSHCIHLKINAINKIAKHQFSFTILKVENKPLYYYAGCRDIFQNGLFTRVQEKKSPETVVYCSRALFINNLLRCCIRWKILCTVHRWLQRIARNSDVNFNMCRILYTHDLSFP